MDDRGRVVQARTAREVEVLANDIRRALGLEAESRVAMLPLLELALPELIDGYEFRVVEDWALGGAEAVTDSHRPIIAMTNRTYQALRRSEPRARMTAAHELGHLMMHCGTPTYYAFGREEDPLTCPERQANNFAAAFLMPEKPFKRLRTVSDIRRTFGVSTDAALCRARKLGHRITDTTNYGTLWTYRPPAPKKRKERKP